MKKIDFLRNEFDYEIDDYDRLKNMVKQTKGKDPFTNKVKMEKVEFDYEEDAYEPK